MIECEKVKKESENEKVFHELSLLFAGLSYCQFKLCGNLEDRNKSSYLFGLVLMNYVECKNLSADDSSTMLFNVMHIMREFFKDVSQLYASGELQHKSAFDILRLVSMYVERIMLA